MPQDYGGRSGSDSIVNVMEYGVVPDGKGAYAAVTSGSPNIGISGTPAFTSADVGKPIRVAQAGVAGADLNTTILSGSIAPSGALPGVDTTGNAATGFTSGTIRLPYGSGIKLTYSVAPTWTWFGE